MGISVGDEVTEALGCFLRAFTFVVTARLVAALRRVETDQAASLPLDAIRCPCDTSIWKSEAALRCRSCRTLRFLFVCRQAMKPNSEAEVAAAAFDYEPAIAAIQNIVRLWRRLCRRACFSKVSLRDKLLKLGFHLKSSASVVRIRQ